MARRLLILITDLDVGGAPRIVAALARGLGGARGRQEGGGAMREGWEVTVVSLAPLRAGGVWEQMQSEGISVESLEVRGVWELPWALVRWRRVLARVRPEIVHSILIHANALAVLGRLVAPRAGRQRGSLPDGRGSDAALGGFEGRPAYVQGMHTLQERPRWHWWLAGRLLRWADGLVVPHPGILEKIPGAKRRVEMQRGDGAGCREVVIPNGIDVERFARAQKADWPGRPVWRTEARHTTEVSGLDEGHAALPGDSTLLPGVVFSSPPAPLALPQAPPLAPAPLEGAKIVGYVGRFDPVKRVDRLVEAFALVRRKSAIGNKLHLVLVGYGEAEEALREQVAALGVGAWVHFTGLTATPERWYKWFDVMVLPSEVEGFGLPIIEAWAAGVPVVAVESPAVGFILGRGEVGRGGGGADRGVIAVAGAGSVALLAEKLQDVMENSEGIWGGDAAAREARKIRAESFSEAAMIARHREFYEIF